MATFSPLIAGKLAPLPVASQQSFTYMSLMCGVLLVLGGTLAYLLFGRQEADLFLKKLNRGILLALFVDGLLAVGYMPHNPFAWVILVLSTLLLLVGWMVR